MDINAKICRYETLKNSAKIAQLYIKFIGYKYQSVKCKISYNNKVKSITFKF